MIGTAGLVQLFLGPALFGEIGERLATSLRGVTSAMGQLRNHRLCRRDRCRH